MGRNAIDPIKLGIRANNAAPIVEASENVREVRTSLQPLGDVCFGRWGLQGWTVLAVDPYASRRELTP